MLLTEVVRKIKDEKLLIDDPNYYTDWPKTGWFLAKNYGQISLDEPSLILFNYVFKSYDDGGYHNATHKLVFDDGTVERRACGFPMYNDTGGYKSINVQGFIWLPAGTYTVKAYLGGDYYDSNNECKPYIGEMKIGKAKFVDMETIEAQEYPGQITKNLAARKTCLGPIKQGVMWIIVNAWTSGAETNFENPGEDLTNGVRIFVDGVQKSWTERRNDAMNQRYNCPYGAGCAWLVLPLTAGQDHTISIQKDSTDTVVWITLIYSPWLLADVESIPVMLELTREATIYIKAEPLNKDVEKVLALGADKALQYPVTDSIPNTKYEKYVSGTGIISLSETFDIMPYDELFLYAKGYSGMGGGCISLISADLRG